MIDRRFTLQALLVAALGGLPGTARADRPDPEAAERLADELRRLEARAYSEEGIPMFLAGENLAATAAGAPAGFEPSALNRQLAAAYRDYAALLPGLEREMTEYDAATLVELLADKDFLRGGK